MSKILDEGATGEMSAEPKLEMVHLLRRVTVELDLLGARFAAAHALHATDLRALIQLLDADRAGVAARPGWLGDRLGLNSASVTALIDRLVGAGYVRRERDVTDRRRVDLLVEQRARDLGWAFFGPLIDQLVNLSAEFTAAELATVRRFLTGAARIASQTPGEIRG